MKPQTIFARWFTTVFAMVFLTACMTNLFDGRRGKLAVEVKWPERSGYSVMAIPEGTVKIELTILGEGLDSPLKETLTPQGEATSRDILDVPIGPKALSAIAYDVDGKQTATGSVNINVLPNTITPARLVLAGVSIEVPVEGSPKPIPSPDATPTPGPDLIIHTVAGDGKPGATDGYASIDGRFRQPQALAYDAKKDVLYVADTANRLIRRYDVKTTLLTTVVGEVPLGEASPTPALMGSGIGTPGGLALGPDGLLYFSDMDAHVIRRLNADGSVSVVAGSGKPGPAKENVSAFEANFYYPAAIAFDPAGALYIADQLNHKIRRLSTRGQVSTVAGIGKDGNTGDGGPAVEAALNYPTAMVFDPKGEYLYLAEARGHRVRRIHVTTGVITPVAGTGRSGVKGEGGPAREAELDLPQALAFDAEGRLLIAEGWSVDLGPDDELGFSNRVLRIDAEGKLQRLAGTLMGNYGYAGDGQDALKATMNRPAGLAVDAAGVIYFTDCFNHVVRALKPGVPYPKPVPSPLPSEATPAAAATTKKP